MYLIPIWSVKHVHIPVAKLCKYYLSIFMDTPRKTMKNSVQIRARFHSFNDVISVSNSIHCQMEGQLVKNKTYWKDIEGRGPHPISGTIPVFP
jgi:ppGpp synthetase/RelA/SpoT-type nucleotidyltranferase